MDDHFLNKGLSQEEVNDLLKEHGYNELSSENEHTLLKVILGVFKEPMFLLLIASSTLYMILGDYKEGSVLLSSTILIIAITIYQHQKTEKALETLKKMSSPRVLVRRDGKEQRIPGREVVPGDVIILSEGDRIAADIELPKPEQLVIDESLLTGESVPVHKNDGVVYAGTLIVRGNSEGIVKATGDKTEFGKIGESLREIKSDQTRLQKEMTNLIKRLFIIGAGISVLVILLFYITRGNILQSILNGLAASMAILPEEFPVVLTVFLALGAWRISKKNVLTRSPSAIETLGSATVLCTDKTGTLTQNKMEIVELFDGKELISKNDSRFESSPVLFHGALASDPRSADPMDVSFTELVKQAGAKYVKTFPLTPEHLMFTRVYSEADGFLVHMKGAPEHVLSKCSHLSTDDLSAINNAIDNATEKGARILAVAHTTCEVLPENINDIDFCFSGLVSFIDPIRPEVPNAIEECRTAGIKVVMITGDHPKTARNIAKMIGMSDPLVMTGEEISEISIDTLSESIKNINVFARVRPEQKLHIVRALQSKNEIVVMTGDGVNDAPALKAADIGIAMGMKGTDVAREAASLVLVDDNFSSIVSAIRSGRKIFDNLQKAMSYIVAVHIPIIGLVLVPGFFPEMPLLLFPMHIIFMELIIDPICSIAFEAEQEEKGIMQRPPRDPNHSFFSNKRILHSVASGLFLLALVLTVFYLAKTEGHTEDEIRAISFATLITGNVFLILTYLSQTRSVFHIFTERNPALLLILAISMIVLFITISVESVQHLFQFSNPGYGHFGISLGVCILMLLIFEIIKLLRLNHLKSKK